MKYLIVEMLRFGELYEKIIRFTNEAFDQKRSS